MTSLFPQIEPLLFGVERPARYVGGEGGSVQPIHGPGIVSWLLAYPDTYEIGLPNQGLQILYELLNEREDSIAERTYAPWIDMEQAMRAEGIPLFSVENHVAAHEFDVLAFNLSAELTYTNVLNMLDLGRVPLRSAERGAHDPVVLAGGHCTYNPEPLAEFLDGVVLGDGEEVVSELTVVIGSWLAQDPSTRRRIDLHRALAGIQGVYVPSLYRPVFDGARQVALEILDPAAPAVVEKRTVTDLGQWPYPKHQLVPLTEVVHDRLNVEVFRGCTRGCRFCQAGMITRPVRERPAAQVVEMVTRGLEQSGYDEVALTSLSTADFSGIEGVVGEIVDAAAHGGRVSVSLPSLRVDAFTVATAAKIQQVRRTGLTFAPEGGTWRMRKVINKLISDEDLFAAVDAAFSQGWRRVKLYFLIGLPTERDEDVLAIAELGRRCVEIGKQYHATVTVTASVGGFVPKPQTPFQWHSQDSLEELTRKVGLLRSESRSVRGLQIKWHEPAATVAEGIVSRGDRRLGAVLEAVWRAGGTFQEWSEHFDLARFTEALAAAGLSAEMYTTRMRDTDELLAWSHLSAGLHEDFLVGEYADALAEVGLEDCRWTPCYDCGACTTYGLEHQVASNQAPAGGSQGTGQGLDLGERVPVALWAQRADQMSGVVPSRLRIRYTKTGRIRYTSQRDMARALERVLRRARLPIAYSEGFSPRPQLSFSLALPTACESMAEFVDLRFAASSEVPDGWTVGEEATDEVLGQVTAHLDSLLPQGLDVVSACALSGSEGSLQEEVTSCDWIVEVTGMGAVQLEERVGSLLGAAEVPIERERKGRRVLDDLRPSILHLSLEGPGASPGALRLHAELATKPRGVRPAELLTGIDSNLRLIRASRIAQWIERDGKRLEPLTADGELLGVAATPTPVGGR